MTAPDNNNNLCECGEPKLSETCGRMPCMQRRYEELKRQCEYIEFWKEEMARKARFFEK